MNRTPVFNNFDPISGLLVNGNTQDERQYPGPACLGDGALPLLSRSVIPHRFVLERSHYGVRLNWHMFWLSLLVMIRKKPGI